MAFPYLTPDNAMICRQVILLTRRLKPLVDHVERAFGLAVQIEKCQRGIDITYGLHRRTTV